MELERFMLWLGTVFASLKEAGVLNIRNVRKVNLALLAKLGWQLLTNAEALWVEIVKKKYFKEEDFMTVSPSSTSSFTWRRLSFWRTSSYQGEAYVVVAICDIRSLGQVLV